MRTAVFIFALLVRIAAVEMTGAAKIAFGDGPDYVAAATSLCVQHTYPERGNLPFFRAPGLPFFIAAVTACEPSRTRAIKYGLAVCDAVSVLLIFLIAQLLHGSRAAGLTAGVLAALHPFFIGAVTDIRTEPLFMMLLVFAIWCLLRGRGAAGVGWVAGAGVAVGLAALVRPTGLICVPLFAVWVWWGRSTWGRLPAGRSAGFQPAGGTGVASAAGWKPAQRPAGNRPHVGGLVVFIGAAIVTLTPWTVRNVLRFGEPIVVNDAGGFNLWRGTHPELMRTVETYDGAEFARRSMVFETETVSAAAKIVDTRASTPKTRDREWRRLAIENVRRDPAYAAKAAFKKAALYWRPWLHPAEHGPKAVALSVIAILGLYILGAIGLIAYPDRRLVLAVLVFFGALWLAHVPYFPSIRLRTPLTDPLLIAFAAAPIARLYLTVAGRVVRSG
jgi:hypothetical protein